MLTWKVWTDDDNPVFEGTEEQARAYIVRHLSGLPGRGTGITRWDSYGYQGGIWVSLDGAWSY